MADGGTGGVLRARSKEQKKKEASAVVVSGDKHLRHVSGWRGVDVLTPRQFADRYPGALPPTA